MTWSLVTSHVLFVSQHFICQPFCFWCFEWKLFFTTNYYHCPDSYLFTWFDFCMWPKLFFVQTGTIDWKWSCLFGPLLGMFSLFTSQIALLIITLSNCKWVIVGFCVHTHLYIHILFEDVKIQLHSSQAHSCYSLIVFICSCHYK